jgi:predicted unusual protein kinase regulating ubiquinone biosynthesis (AarF/ABC1/UbiB family)
MPNNPVSVEDVKRALNIEKFSELSKDKVYYEATTNMMNMITQLKSMCDNALKENSDSQKSSVEAYGKILDDLGEILMRDNITSEERAVISDKMITIADKISLKDTENKDFLNNIIKYGSSVIGGALFLGAIILGVNVKGTKIPTLPQ